MEMLVTLVDTGARVDLPVPAEYVPASDGGSYPIHLAVARGKPELVSFLLNRGARIEQRRSVSQSSLMYVYNVCTVYAIPILSYMYMYMVHVYTYIIHVYMHIIYTCSTYMYMHMYIHVSRCTCTCTPDSHVMYILIHSMCDGLYMF